jgi:perosamine synthetase
LCGDDDEHRRSWFVYVVALPRGVDRARVMDELRAAGIGTAEYVPCVHLQPYMRETYGFAEGLCPVAEDFASRSIALPFYPQLEAEDQERVVETLRAAL